MGSPQCSFQDLNLSSLGDGAVQLQVSQQLHHSSFRKVVSVVVAMEKLRNVPVGFSQSLQDDDLRSLFFLIFEEGTESELRADRKSPLISFSEVHNAADN